MQPQEEEEKQSDAVDVTLTEPDQPQQSLHHNDNDHPNQHHITPKMPTPPTDKTESKELEHNNHAAPPPAQKRHSLPERHSMTPPRSKSTSPDDDKHSIINSCAVLIIPLDNRVTPQMVANKFVKYGKILQVRPMKKSSTCIVIFSKPSEASNCIRLFENHDKVRVARPDQRDWNMCGEAIAMPAATHSNHVSVEKVNDEDSEEKKAVNDKIASHEVTQSRVSSMYKQRHAYQMLIENDEIERKKRMKNNALILARIEVMYKTSEELHGYLRKMIELDVKHEENIHRSVLSTFGTMENGGSVHSAGIAIDALLKNRYEQFNDINERVFKNILLSSQKYQNKLKQQMSYFQNRIAKFNAKCEEYKDRLSQEWNKYQNILNRNLKLQQAQQEGKQLSSGEQQELQQTDPFLSGKAYHAAQKEYKAALSQYNEEMSELFNKIIAEDKKRIDGIKTILIDYFLAEKAKAMNHVKLIESSLEYIKCVDKEHDTNDFIKRFSHVQQTISSSPDASLSQLPIPENAKQAPKTKKRAPSPKRAVSQPVISTKGGKANFVQTPEGVLIQGATTTDHMAFNFSESESFTQHSKELTDLIREDIVRSGIVHRPGRIIASNWKPMHANLTHFGWFHAFEQKGDIKPVVSVYLKGTTIKLKDKDKKTGLFTFEIIVPNASWFSLTGTPTTYLYRVEKADECAEWITNLKKYAKVK
eukprot:CAMPEP_0197029604 /NCGR_PEP_ID=MMETSP1384-20130603/9014_1 /TAXON_ID=29189 /ORGANISM="Ammonia sp." /LENGTH=701 /DNA_ID=CAMNT_0042458807 /DNA_START=35 /DNA_END=2140 /DNA_ORIENTATION=+